jgi:hypothetical protein
MYALGNTQPRFSIRTIRLIPVQASILFFSNIFMQKPFRGSKYKFIVRGLLRSWKYTTEIQYTDN